MSAADYSWGSGDILAQLRTAQAEVSRLRATVARVEAMAAEWESQAASGVKVHCGRRLLAALGGDR